MPSEPFYPMPQNPSVLLLLPLPTSLAILSSLALMCEGQPALHLGKPNSPPHAFDPIPSPLLWELAPSIILSHK